MVSRALLLVVVAALASAFCSSQQVTAPDFSIILLPDTQNEAQYYPQVLNSQTQWIAANQANLNIQAVLGLGDIVNDGAELDEQQNADAAIKILDNAGVPYFLAIGNHDYDAANTGAATRDADGFNRWFGPARYAGKSYYQGNFPTGSNENFYGVLKINGQRYLILVLEYVPRTASLNWAKSIVQANSDKEVIVVTHTFLYYDGTRTDACDTQDLTRDNDGEETWGAFASLYPNIIMVVNGHLTAKVAARRADLGVNGNLVNQMFSNYQTYPNGGNGWLRILTFHPGSNTISVQTYSPYLNAYKTDGDNQFTIYYHNPGFNTGVGQITGRVRSSGCAKIANAAVSAGNSSTLTDANGNFSLSVPPGSYTLSVSGDGWEPQTRSVRVDDNYASDNNFYLSAAFTACPLNSASPSVTICTPAANASVSSPVHIVAGATDATPVKSMQVYVDGALKFSASGRSLDTSVAMASGTRRLTVQANDGTTIFKQTIYITVTAAQSTLAVSQTSLTFASQNVGTSSAPQAVNVVNGTSNPINITSITASGDYSQVNNCGASLAAGTSCAVNVTFTPTAAGTRSGTLTITDSDSSSPQAVSLSGTGAAASSCNGSTVNPSVTICSPAANATVSSPVHIVATATDSKSVSYLQIYVDGVKQYQVSGGSLDTSVAMSTGTRRLTVQAGDGATIFKQTIYITVQ